MIYLTVYLCQLFVIVTRICYCYYLFLFVSFSLFIQYYSLLDYLLHLSFEFLF
jgi:hypothetical protein